MGVNPLKSAVFLDRDGVLNRAIVREGRPYPPASAEEMEITPGAALALARLREAGFLLLVVTNQPDVARGKQTQGAVEAMHEMMAAKLPVDAFIVCYHDDRDDCPCRKPKPGLLRIGAARHQVDLATSFMVGDRWRDVDAGAAAGCRTILLDCQYAERGPTSPPDATVSSLAEAVDWILDCYTTTGAF
jgi:D-glycero-D-manno-heptose 1,7-bisphosphate phosphatase